MIEKVKLLDFIFSGTPSRTELMSYQPIFSNQRFKVSVYRNHSFELIDKTSSPYLDLAEIKVEFEYSDYDDSLSFLNLNTNSDLVIVWLDLTRYEKNIVQDFVSERISVLKTLFKKNILLATFGYNLNLNESRVFHYDIEKWSNCLGSSLLDERLERFSGTKLSMSTCELVSKDLSLNYIPSLLVPSLKCVVVDLDNTLYEGVLGEDGAGGVVFHPGHLKLHQKLKDLAETGIFICIASKNNHDDVIDFIKNRKDFILDIDDFACIAASWDSKARTISGFEKELNIHSSSFLFIDDNMGELLEVSNAHPEIKFIHAKDDALVTFNALANYPRLLKLSVSLEDTLRNRDAKANSRRKEFQRSLSKEEYIKSLNMQLTYSIDDDSSISRVAELSNKTNQFIFNYRRYDASEVESLICSPESCVVTVSLKDKLSDSGIIGVVVLKRVDENTAILDECFVSCRALGRGIDGAIVLGAIYYALESLKNKSLLVSYEVGARNKPAVDFIENKLSNYVLNSKIFDYKVSSDVLDIKVEGKK